MYAQQSKYSGLSLKESDPKFAGAATCVHTSTTRIPQDAASTPQHLFAHTPCSHRAQPFTRDPTIGYLKLNFASQSLRLSISILPRPCMLTQCQLQPRAASARFLAAHVSPRAALPQSQRKAPQKCAQQWPCAETARCICWRHSQSCGLLRRQSTAKGPESSEQG